MSAITIATLSHGLIVSGTFPAPFDVRDGVDNGSGNPGTLTSPAPADVRNGTQYGGDGDQYTGTLNTPPAPSGNEWADCFAELQQTCEEEIGANEVVTINGVGYACIASELTSDEMLVHGGTGENGGFSVMVPVSAFVSDPTKTQTIVYQGVTLSVLSFTETNKATYTIIAGDFTRNP
jgi:hypothetical protein